MDGFFNTWTSSKVTSFDKFKNGEWVVLAQMSETPIRDLIVPNVPTIPLLAKNEEQRLILKYGTSTPNAFGKVYVLPPGVPADRAMALEAAFARTLADKELLAEADKAKFEQAANNAKTGCPISRVLNATITMDAKLES